jgi:hypothetical protein
VAANAIDLAPLDEVKAAYDGPILRYRRAEQGATLCADMTWTASRTREKRALEDEFRRTRATHGEVVEGLGERLVWAAFLRVTEAKPLLQEGDGRIYAVVSAAKYAEKRALAREAMRWRRQADVLLRFRSGDREGTAQVFDLVVATPGGRALARAHLKRVRGEPQRAYSVFPSVTEQCLAAAAQARAKAVAWARGLWSSVEPEIRRRLLPATKAVRAHADSLP